MRQGGLLMATVHVSAERLIRAAPARVYTYLANYRDDHPKILPPAFSDYLVEEGGIGEGTIISFTVTTGGRARAMRARVTEPEPGRQLMESDLDSDLVTIFLVDPEGNDSRVRITTTWQRQGGLNGFVEQLFAPMMLRRLYDEELANLDEYAREREPLGQASGPSTAGPA